MTRKNFIIRLVIILGFCIYVMFPVLEEHQDHISYPNDLLIAHAGGGVNGFTYSNSLEALETSKENGFVYIELDFVSAENGDLVLLHGWNDAHFRFFSRFPRLPRVFRNIVKVQAKDSQSFKNRTMRGGLTPLTFVDLLEWLNRNPKAFIITDFKDNNLQGLEKLSSYENVSLDRFIPQIYEPAEYDPVKSLGFDKIIFTTYKSPLTAQDIYHFSTTHDLFALTVPKARLGSNTNEIFKDLPTLLLTHTVNDFQKAQQYENWGVDGFYTDYLYPEVD